MNESRHDLLSWVNSLLQLNISKIEQCGTGAVYCQIFDSIFLDVPLIKVNFDAKTKPQFTQNFKILQVTFTRHNIDRVIPIEALMKCKMQDNLEFLQWSKRYWDQFYPGGDYNAVEQRKSTGGFLSVARLESSTSPRSRSGGVVSATPAHSRPGRVGVAEAVPSAFLVKQNATLKETLTGLERERDFYFTKLQDIELLVQRALEIVENNLNKAEFVEVLKNIQSILYSTEEGFEIPQEPEFEDTAHEG